MNATWSPTSTWTSNARCAPTWLTPHPISGSSVRKEVTPAPRPPSGYLTPYGTANFARGLAVCGVSLALVRGHTPMVGVIALPLLGRRYWAAAGRGAHRDGKPIRASQRTHLQEAMVALGDYGTGEGALERNLIAFTLDQELAPRVERLRRLGSAAADLVLVADGTLDASLTLGNRTWDMAAGTLIAREAGAMVADSAGTDHTTTSICTLALAPGLADELLALVATSVRGTRYAPDSRS